MRPHTSVFPLATLLAALVLSLAGLSGCTSSPKRPASDHFDGERFFNPWSGPIDKPFWDLIKWQWGGTRPEWPDSVPVAPVSLPWNDTSNAAHGRVSVTFVNHATFVVRFPTPDSALTVVIDPIWSDRCSPVSFAGPRRVHAPGVPFDDLPRTDVVLVSHNHYDHMDMPTLVRLAERDNPLFLVPLGDAELLRDAGIPRVEEMDWWQTKSVAGVALTFLPAQHWSNRLDKARNTSLWGSWGLKARAARSHSPADSVTDSIAVYHAGDTGYGPHFAAIGARWGAPDMALLPIGAYKPRWFMKEAHTDPSDAVQAYRDLGAASALGMHFGTFRLADEPYGSPETDLAAARDAIGDTAFFAPLPGQTFFIEKPSIPKH